MISLFLFWRNLYFKFAKFSTFILCIAYPNFNVNINSDFGSTLFDYIISVLIILSHYFRIILKSDNSGGAWFVIKDIYIQLSRLIYYGIILVSVDIKKFLWFKFRLDLHVSSLCPSFSCFLYKLYYRYHWLSTLFFNVFILHNY